MKYFLDNYIYEITKKFKLKIKKCPDLTRFLKQVIIGSMNFSTFFISTEIEDKL